MCVVISIRKPVNTFIIILNPLRSEVKSYVLHRLHKLNSQYMNITSKVLEFKYSGLNYFTYFLLSIGKPLNDYTVKLNQLGLEVRPSDCIDCRY